MAPPPKAILFDIGGVVVLSPFRAILSYERAHSIPPGWINYAIQRGPKDTGAWQLIERGAVPLDEAWFQAFKAQLEDVGSWGEFWRNRDMKDKKENGSSSRSDDISTSPPPLPIIDAKTLFWSMMRIARTPDPYMYPALRALRRSGRFVLGALSNTVVFPVGVVDERGVGFTGEVVLSSGSGSGSSSANGGGDGGGGVVRDEEKEEKVEEIKHISQLFDIYISSAHVGIRKPDPAAYELAVRELSRFSREKHGGEEGIEPRDVLFLDDIGVNLKGAKSCGLRTFKVELGRSREAVRELERVTGLRLLGEEEKEEGRERARI